MKITLSIVIAAILSAIGISAVTATDFAPVGTIVLWASDTPPDGWLECSGAAVSRVTYSDLYNVWGSKFGNGNGSTTFNLIDLRGYFVRGWDNGAGVDPDSNSRTDRGDGAIGNNIGTVQQDSFKMHSHAQDGQSGYTVGAHIGDVRGIFPNNVQTGSTGGSETRPKNKNLMYIVKAFNRLGCYVINH